jgi:hypothetical protein
MDERAVLARQNMRQSAIDKIARMHALDEMGLTEDDGSPGLANPDAFTPSHVPIQTGMEGGTNPALPVASPADLAMKKLYSIPNAQGGVDQYRKKTASELAQDPKAVYEAQKQQDELNRQMKLDAQREAAKAVDPIDLQKALAGDPAARARVIAKNPALQTTFDKMYQAPVTHVAPGEGIFVDGKWTVPVAAKPAADEDKTLYEIDDPAHPGQTIRVPRSKAIGMKVTPKGASSVAGTSADVLNDAIAKVRSIDPTKFGPIDSDATAGAVTKVLQGDDAQQYNTALGTIANAYAAAISKTGRMTPAAARMAAQAALPSMSDKPGNRQQKWNNAKKMADFVEKVISGAPGNQPSPTAPTVPTGKVSAKDLVHAAINNQPMPEDE